MLVDFVNSAGAYDAGVRPNFCMRRKMLARFGQLLCWGALCVALLCAALVLYLAFSGDPDRYSGMIIFAIFGVTVWVLGRALNHALLKN
jgi:hypothetical protein